MVNTGHMTSREALAGTEEEGGHLWENVSVPLWISLEIQCGVTQKITRPLFLHLHKAVSCPFQI